MEKEKNALSIQTWHDKKGWTPIFG